MDGGVPGFRRPAGFVGEVRRCEGAKDWNPLIPLQLSSHPEARPSARRGISQATAGPWDRAPDASEARCGSRTEAEATIHPEASVSASSIRAIHLIDLRQSRRAGWFIIERCASKRLISKVLRVVDEDRSGSTDCD